MNTIETVNKEFNFGNIGSMVDIPGNVSFRPVAIPQDQYSTVGFVAATVTLASAAAIGANMVDVKNGTMSKSTAIINGLVKGAAASVILSLSDKKTVTGIAFTGVALAGAGYMIDKIMKKNRKTICEVSGENK